MVSEEQKKANEENAKLGGVKTPEGKEVMRQSMASLRLNFQITKNQMLLTSNSSLLMNINRLGLNKTC